MAINHVKAIHTCSGARIVGVADPQGVSAKLQALLPGSATWFASAEEMLDAARPDVVHIVTPPSTHAHLACLCLSRGMHVYVEKPFTLTSADARDVLEAARAAGRLVCPGHQLLSEKPARLLAEARGLIGSVVHVESYFSFRTVRKSTDGRSPMSPVEQLLDILPHPVYTLLDQLRASAPTSAPEVVSVDVRAEGEVRAVLRAGDVSAMLVVTLRGRPVESYLRVVGTNGSLRADFVRGALINLAGPATSVIALMMNPVREGTQIVIRSAKGFARRIRERNKGYPGLNELFESFYRAIRDGDTTPHTHESILDTVRACEQVADALRMASAARERQAEADLTAREKTLPAIDRARGVVLVTGATGTLGRAVVADLRANGWAVRGTGRRVPPPSLREAGIEYVAADLGEEIRPDLFAGVSTIVHCAAETAGGKDAHDRNTVAATAALLRQAAASGVKRFLHVSSIAVLKTSKAVGGPVNEQTPVDYDPARGPYVWAKATAERDVVENGPALGLTVRVIRPGPLVDFRAFQPPGRLGRELGPIFLGIGPRKGGLSLCDVSAAAMVIRSTVEHFDAAPPLLNLVEPVAPTRVELLERFRRDRPDLRAMWLPAWVLGMLSPVAMLAQRVLLKSKNPVNVAAAFSSERYDTALAAQAFERAHGGAKPAPYAKSA
jgi:predicted dehydrogenase/nucleoside-diphosphate-sugar epimerase